MSARQEDEPCQEQCDEGERGKRGVITMRPEELEAAMSTRYVEPEDVHPAKERWLDERAEMGAQDRQEPTTQDDFNFPDPATDCDEWFV